MNDATFWDRINAALYAARKRTDDLTLHVYIGGGKARLTRQRKTIADNLSADELIAELERL